ncbi:DUF4262 domain-containing protein [Sphingomonas sp. ID1715]|jgi:hypothetical protein|uniref:DUF4262 domain-containing protein n=1 Tax=Sphingobium cyanobacteriorum TaxID=3063954 RepID=A0ABT8ZS70_9SPHN|nr:MULTISPECIES: DUF4262 domain-containing protein [Sphingomonadaceae]MDO7837052.1 DUF4262 domain-containing protein [Sphingobium sp. HBC34]NNM78451.1 DUF4262 domain-containing protein [Sphingomonas sp. ID1715]HUD29493.1 DUF4262 domain-containing protein [Novosphingobium sp.]|tara:strand:+ start:1299 stop:1733 length:435 start_codon:yes stop_codon:yes gene_type:complete
MTDASDFYAVIERNIARSGQHMFLVFADGETPAFAYSIGNALHGLPELLLVGNFSPRVAGSIINDLGRKMREARRPLEGDIDVGGQFPVRVRRASAKAHQCFTLQAGRYLRHEEYDVLQVLLCDAAGIYPGEPGCEPAYDVPLA